MAMGKMSVAPARGRKLSYRQVKQVQKIVNSNKRLKSFYKSNITGEIITTGQMVQLADVPEGDNYNQRDADQINAASLRVQWSISNDSSNAQAYYRVIIARALHDGLVVANFPTYSGEPDLDKMQVLYDEVSSIGPGTSGNINPENRFYFKSFKNKKVPHMKIAYDDDESDLPTQNGLYFYWVSSVASAGPIGIVQSKLKFFDRS